MVEQNPQHHLCATDSRQPWPAGISQLLLQHRLQPKVCFLSSQIWLHPSPAFLISNYHSQKGQLKLPFHRSISCRELQGPSPKIKLHRTEANRECFSFRWADVNLCITASTSQRPFHCPFLLAGRICTIGHETNGKAAVHFIIQNSTSYLETQLVGSGLLCKKGRWGYTHRTNAALLISQQSDLSYTNWSPQHHCAIIVFGNTSL